MGSVTGILGMFWGPRLRDVGEILLPISTIGSGCPQALPLWVDPLIVNKKYFGGKMFCCC